MAVVWVEASDVEVFFFSFTTNYCHFNSRGKLLALLRQLERIFSFCCHACLFAGNFLLLRLFTRTFIAVRRFIISRIILRLRIIAVISLFKVCFALDQTLICDIRLVDLSAAILWPAIFTWIID